MQQISVSARTLQALLTQYRAVTIVSHINPDADAIGTSLGLYGWLREQGYRVEVVNASEDIPRFLDFLPYFSKIKHSMDFEDSLVISCDCGSLDRTGFDLEGREIVNIDHHLSNRMFGRLNIVDAQAAASAEVAYRVITTLHPVSRESATAFYAALVSDTRNFTTSNMRRETLEFAVELAGLGVDIASLSSQMLHRRSLASLRVLGAAIDSLRLLEDARVAVMSISREMLERTGAKQSDLDGVVDYAKSLVTVEVAVMLVEQAQEIKVSLRSKQADVGSVAQEFGGGGHMHAGGFEAKGIDMEALLQRLLVKIKERGVLE